MTRWYATEDMVEAMSVGYIGEVVTGVRVIPSAIKTALGLKVPKDKHIIYCGELTNELSDKFGYIKGQPGD